MKKRFVAYYYCNGADLSLGISLHFSMPNIEIHLPFGFIRIGWEDGAGPRNLGADLGHTFLYRSWGLK